MKRTEKHYISYPENLKQILDLEHFMSCVKSLELISI